jgi:hypothetical protein
VFKQVEDRSLTVLQPLHSINGDHWCCLLVLAKTKDRPAFLFGCKSISGLMAAQITQLGFDPKDVEPVYLHQTGWFALACSF